MKIGIVTVQVPFIRGGAEIHAESLKAELIARGFDVDIVALPFKWYPPETLLDHMLAARLIDLTEVNGEQIQRLITLKFPAYYTPHPNKVAWILHQHRQAYDLYDTPYGDLHGSESGRAVAREISRWDRSFLPQHRSLFANSRRVADRLRSYNDLIAEPLYHPPGNSDRFRCDPYENFILVPGRLDTLKRQHLAIEALAFTPEPLKLVLIGAAVKRYEDEVRRKVTDLGLHNRVVFRGLVAEEEKLALFARCLAVYYGVYDEDYGYITLEAFLASKPIITHNDSGGPLEFVTDEENGYVVPPEAAYIAERFRTLLDKPLCAQAMGRAGRASLAAKGITWGHVIERLMS
jgi:glycosyltransferase involved in cell wall biosynthesis